MSYSVLQDIPIVVNLPTAANDTGWTIDGNIATHESCNSGYIRMKTYPLNVDLVYQVSYTVLTISGGYVALFAGTVEGTHRTTPGVYVETINVTGSSPHFSFFSDANCTLQAFVPRIADSGGEQFSTNTIVFSRLNNKWSDFRTIAPELGFSIYIDTFTMKDGGFWKHVNGSTNRNNFYGEQFASVFQFVDNKDPVLIKSYNSIAVQGNQLMVTTTNGVETSLGQLSDLNEIDFLKAKLVDGITTVNVYSREGIYSASFWRDKGSPGRLLNGDQIKGNYIIVELINSTTPSAVLKIFSIGVNSSISRIGVR